MKKLFFICCIALSFTILLTGCDFNNNSFTVSSSLTSNNKSIGDMLKVHFIDVGQGDSILIQYDDKNILIDAGPGDSSKKLVNYLNSLEIKKFDYIIATHPHEDHIGGMAKVINSFYVNKFYAPRKQSSSKAFENMVKALKNKNLKINVAKQGLSLDIDPNINALILAPNSPKYDDTNNYSVVLKVCYKDNSFLFTGDAEKLSEKEILNSGFNLKSDVLKVGHHGSSSSCCDEFLNEVNPQYAVISVGKGNHYNHPNKDTLNSLKERNVVVYRTDEQGTIVLSSDGTHILKK